MAITWLDTPDVPLATPDASIDFVASGNVRAISVQYAPPWPEERAYRDGAFLPPYGESTRSGQTFSLRRSGGWLQPPRVWIDEDTSPAVGARFPIPTVGPVEVLVEPTNEQAMRDPRTDLLLDSVTHDLVIEDGDLVLARGPRVRGQRLKIALAHVRGEWFLDLTQGTDWFGSVLGKSTAVMRRVELNKRLLSVPGVRDVASINLWLDPATRALAGTVHVVDMSGAELAAEVRGV